MPHAIEPHNSWLPLQAAAAEETDPRRAQLIREVGLHMEAEITGQLQHPNIIPIYDMGVLDSGELYYTMKEVRRHSLREVVDGLAEGLGARLVAHARRRLTGPDRDPIPSTPSRRPARSRRASSLPGRADRSSE